MIIVPLCGIQNSAYRFVLSILKYAYMKINALGKKLLLLICIVILIYFLSEKIFLLNEKKFFFDTHVYVQQAKPVLHQISNLPGLSYELIPGAIAENGFFKINSHGIRDREYSIPKPKNVFRIIILGDSVTFGTEYPIEQTYAKILEQKLNSNPNSSVKYEVLNAGVCAYNAIQKFILLKNRLLDYKPDLVIFQFINDDYYRNAVVLPGEANHESHILINMGEYFSLNFPNIMPFNNKIDRFLKKHSATYRLINKSIYDFMSIRNPDKYLPQAYKYAGFNDLSESIKENKQIFKQFEVLARKEKFQFILMLVPDLKNTDNLDPWIRQTGTNGLNFKILDLFKQFKSRGIDLTELRITPQGICHFNLIGHELTADILKHWLSKNVKLVLSDNN